MKRFLIIIALATMVFSSCGSSAQKGKRTTYTIVYNADSNPLFEIYFLLGASVTESVTICEYNDKNERVNIQDMENVRYGSKQTFTPNSRAEKIVVCMEVEMTLNGRTEEIESWIAQVFYLEKGSNITIEIGEKTKVLSHCPID